MCLLSVFCSLVYKSKYSTWIRLRLPLITFDFSETILNLHEHRLIHIYIYMDICFIIFIMFCLCQPSKANPCTFVEVALLSSKIDSLRSAQSDIVFFE